MKVKLIHMAMFRMQIINFEKDFACQRPVYVKKYLQWAKFGSPWYLKWKEKPHVAKKWNIHS